MSIVNIQTSGKVTYSTNEIVVPDDFPTIQAAVDAAGMYGKVRVKPGTYYENILIDEGFLEIKGDNHLTTIIDGGGDGNVVRISAHGVRIEGFTIKNGVSGISFTFGLASYVIGNSIIENDVGIETETFGHTIYHNNFIDNTQQVDLIPENHLFHNNYPSGGNFWDDYNGVDQNSGSNQDQPGSDGIGDKPYNVLGFEYGQDKYPFIEENGWLDNLPPSTPVITGTESGKVGEEYTYTASSEDPDNDDIQYKFKFGDDVETGWLNPNSENDRTYNHAFDEEGDFVIKAKAKDSHGAETNWGTLEVSMPKSKNKEKTINSWEMTKFKKIEIEGTFISTDINKILFQRFDLDPVLVYLPNTEDYTSDCVIKKITITYRNGNQEKFVKPDDGTINRIDIWGRLAVWDAVPKVAGEQYEHSVKGTIYFGGSINTEYI
jgi:hypothetical protein